MGGHIEHLKSLLTEVLGRGELHGDHAQDSGHSEGFDETSPEAPRIEHLSIDTSGLMGRVAAARVRAPCALPSFDNSQMDGFAVRASDLGRSDGIGGVAGDVVLPVSEVVAAGAAPGELTPGTAAAVMTGAPIPHGAELVIPVEKTAEGFASVTAHSAADQPGQNTASDGAQVTLRGLTEADLKAGQFIRRAGTDVQEGEVVVERGQLLTPARIGALAACGQAQVPVIQRIRTLIISTGDEIRRPGETLAPGQIFDANTALLAAACESFGHQVAQAHVPSDDPQTFLHALRAERCQYQPDLVVTAGGISAGAFEVVRQALEASGAEFTSVAQQPGGPQGSGLLPAEEMKESTVPTAALIALPGNPVSAAVSCETLLRPALSAVDAGCPPPQRREATLTEDMTSPAGITQYRRVQLEQATSFATPVGGPSSHLLGHLAHADALIELGPDDVEVPAGSLRPVILLYPGWHG